MKKKSVTLLIITFTFFASIPHSITKTNVLSEQDTPAILLDTIVDDLQKQINQLSIILSGLSGMISDNQISTIKNKTDSLKNIKQMNLLLQSVLREKFIQINLTAVVFLIHFNNHAINHVHAMLKNGLTNFNPFDANAIIQRNITNEIAPAELQRSLKKNKELIKQVTHEADSAGLKWYNKLYRIFDYTIIDPCKKYSIPSRALITAASFAGLTWLWWRLGNSSFQENAPTWLQKICGEKPDYTISPSTHYFECKNYSDLGPLGRLDHFLSEINHNLSPFGPIVGGWAAVQLYKEFNENLQPWTAQKCSEFHNRMMGGAYLKEAQKAANKIDDVHFDDLVGLDPVKESFQLLVDYLENPEPFDRLGLTPPKGILLVGETRTGKSYSVKALFGEINKMHKRTGGDNDFHFIELPASLINSKGISYLLDLIKKTAPCIVFIDEIDLLDLQRKGKNEMLTEFLTCMSGTVESNDSKNQVIIIAATNRPENLDEALRQPGRFGKEIRFEYPSYTDRKTFILNKFDKLSLDPACFDVEKLVDETAGKSYEALNILINYAVLKARIRGQGINQKHMDEILDEELRHIISCDNKILPEHEKKLLSAHFAGHTLALHLLDMHTKFSKVTIKQVMTEIKEEAMGMHLYLDTDKKQKRFEYGSVFTYVDQDTIKINSLEEKLAACKYHLSGIVAEELLFGSCSYSCHTEDHERALAIAKSISFEGLDVSKLPKHIQKERFDKAFEIVANCKKEMEKVLSTHKDTLIKLMITLEEKQTLNAQEVKEIIENAC